MLPSAHYNSLWMMGKMTKAKVKSKLSRNHKLRWKKCISKKSKIKWPEHLRIEWKQNIAKRGLEETYQNYKTKEG